MNSRFIPLTVVVVSFALATFFIVYFEGLWRWLVASPVLAFVTWPALRVGLFAPQADVDRMTSADKMESPINPFLIAVELITFSRFLFYGLALYLGFIDYSFYAVFAIAAFVCLVKTFNPLRFNLIRDAKRRNGFLGLLRIYLYMYVVDTLAVGITYGVGYFVGAVL